MYQHISRKLRSRNGVSMLLAMVFLMFCVFVGGTVLAAATANGYRVAHLSDQQQYLNERSAALLLADQMQPSSTVIQLVAKDVNVSKQQCIYGDGGTWEPDTSVPPTVTRTVSFEVKADGSVTAMQRLMIESAVWRYLKDNGINETVQVKDFAWNGTLITDSSMFWSQYADPTTAEITGAINVTGTLKSGGDVFTNYTARYLCNSDFDFLVDFGDDSQLTVGMFATSFRADPIVQIPPLVEEGGVYYQITSQQVRTVIIWDNAEIEKGGAA